MPRSKPTRRANRARASRSSRRRSRAWRNNPSRRPHRCARSSATSRKRPAPRCWLPNRALRRCRPGLSKLPRPANRSACWPTASRTLPRRRPRLRRRASNRWLECIRWRRRWRTSSRPACRMCPAPNRRRLPRRTCMSWGRSCSNWRRSTRYEGKQNSQGGNMTISKKIIGGYAIVLAALALVILVAFTSISRIQASYDHFLDENERLVSGAEELRFELRNQIAHYRAILLYPDQQKKYWDELQDDHRRFAETIEKMRRLAVSSEGLSMLNEIAALQEKHEHWQELAVGLAQRGKRAEALALGIKEVRPLTDTLTDKAERFRERELKIEAAGRAELAASA